MKKILAFSSIRSDYDIMSPLYELLKNDDEIDFRIGISGAHLSKEFGLSVDQIKNDGIKILFQVQTLLSGDTKVSRLKSASILLQNIIERVDEFSPDLLIYAGDREDMLVYAMVGGYLGIPTLHFYGGDYAKDGYIDNAVRNATSKLSTFHCVSIEKFKQRLIKMGEEPDRIFVTGNLSLDRFISFKPLKKSEILAHFDLDDDFSEFALCIFHPVTQEIQKADVYFENILLNLKERGIKTFVSYPNTDHGNSKIFDVIAKYKDDKNFVFYKNLDREIFVSIYKHSKLIIGNSSSGVLGEAASIGIPTVNVGFRQLGRLSDKSVIFCKSGFDDIKNALELALSDEFLTSIKGQKSMYGDGNAAKRAYEIIKNTDFKSKILKTYDPLEG
ncbi:UDP-N-acetylglucosamine 2-epimerase [Campylobacter suis]|uniref:UDP-N,N'-diacetylbacillosamine 2-epimerase (Hydrolyzing) n=1 Tax=Campylobacter suis TaxID=2790657 RepID=A0ABM8Q6X5_9BACT|nr:UDP-N-acetylglucosamine 2-epimerase [Campylobacter suis]CAD7288717.1 UDP-N,N'-diacetylbacillosamine 2-epimerase (hydrolyzing) [Campylobacter suis]